MENRRLLSNRAKFIVGESNSGHLWNDDLLYVASISDISATPRLSIRTSSYFQYLSACGALEDETSVAVRSRRPATPIRDRAMLSVEAAAACRLGASGLGMQVTVVFPMDGDIKVLVQRRSLGVATYAGSLAVVPVFACQPSATGGGGPPSLFHNFLREYLEELYDVRDVERYTSHLDHRWFYAEPAAQALLALKASGGFVFELLGVGVDALNGEVNIAALAILLDPEFVKRELPRMKANWEMTSVEVAPLYSPKLCKQVLADEFRPGSAFSLALAMDRVSSAYAVRLAG
jgi:hypothetical protein